MANRTLTPYARWRNHYLKKGYSVGISRSLARTAYDLGADPPPFIWEEPEKFTEDGEPLEDARPPELIKKEEKIVKKAPPPFVAPKFSGPEYPDGKTLPAPSKFNDAKLRVPEDRKYIIFRLADAKTKDITGENLLEHANVYFRECYHIEIGETREIKIPRSKLPPFLIRITRLN